MIDWKLKYLQIINTSTNSKSTFTELQKPVGKIKVLFEYLK